MNTSPDKTREIFSFHLVDVTAFQALRFLISPMHTKNIPGLKHSESLRFIKWGKPVEHQVRDHNAQSLALAAMRPFNTFTTFSIWKNENAMEQMVNNMAHQSAMEERSRKNFHHEFSTMRFTPIKEKGLWRGKSNYVFGL